MPSEGHVGGHGLGHGHGWGSSSGWRSFHGIHHHGCCMGGGWRRFVPPVEELERLHKYLAEPKDEIAGVEARIHELKAK